MVEFSSTNQPNHDRAEASRRGWTFRNTLERLLADPEAPTGSNDRVPMYERIVRAHMKKAAKGDIPAIKELYDRVDGKTAQGIELTGKDGGPVETRDLSDPVFAKDIARRLAFVLTTGANAST